MKLPNRHLSVRVPWHDNGWNGQICKTSRNNSSCMFLPRIQDKDVDFEEENKCEWMHKIPVDKLPPCVDEKVTFLSPNNICNNKKRHPYADFEDLYKHYKPSPLTYPAYSFSIIPYNWMLKDKETKENAKAKEFNLLYDVEKEPQLRFQDQWVQHIDNQKVLLDAFASAVVPDKTLIFIYAKNIPLIDRLDRILIGVTTVNSIGSLTEYQYDTENPPMRSVFWERPIYHGLNPKYGEGFILPYQKIIEKLKGESEEVIEQYIAYAPNFEEFSYGSDLVSHDTAIDALISLRNALINISSLLYEEELYYEQLNWLNKRISNLWNMRGAFPGLGPVLSALKVPEGNVVAWEIEKYLSQKDGDKPITNPWDVVEDIFKGQTNWLRYDLSKKIGKIFAGIWGSMPSERKDYLKLLSRLAINNEQADYFYDRTNPKPYLQNMYLFFEESISSAHPVGLNVVDKALYMKDEIMSVFPLPQQAQPDGVHDARRIRAFVINSLEKFANSGHSLQTQDQTITSINERDKENPLDITRDILNHAEQFFDDKIEVCTIEKDENNSEGYKYYKLNRYAEYKAIIYHCVHNRVHKARRIKFEKDWHKIIDEHLKPISQDASKWEKSKEERARNEKAATLNEISQSRFTIIVGPAGTGKTTLLNIFCSQREINNPGILILAPTGKARVKLGGEAKTIAQFLSQYKRYNAITGRYYPNPEAPRFAQARTIIIDEASMLTEDQLAAVLDAVIDYDRLILVGDPRQLPPIGTGKPFVEMVRYLKPEVIEPDKPFVCKGYAELKEIFRQGDDEEDVGSQERIDVRLSRWFSSSLIRKEEEDIFDEVVLHPNKNWSSLKLVEWYNINDLEERILEELEKELSLKNRRDNIGFDVSLGAKESKGYAYFNIGSGREAEKWQILSPVNANGFGTKEINRLIHKTFHAKTIDLAVNPPDLRRGNYTFKNVKRIPEPVGIDNMVYGDKVINLRNTRWDKRWQYIYNPNKKETLDYFANGEIGTIIGEFRSGKYLLNHFGTPKHKKGKLYPPTVQVEFSSQPGYAYCFNSSLFKEDGDLEFELAYAVTVHKSQGSGFKTVFLILPNPCSLLSRELMYTALTRQEDRIIIFHQGDFKDFKKYIGDNFSETGRRLTDLFHKPVLKEIQKRYYDSNYVQISAQGEFMISKSEVIIADQLFYQNVPYAYEQPITDDRGITIHPDFTIENRELGVIFYWEHLGMLTNDNYRKKWNLKQTWYARNGVVPYKKVTQDDDKILITTRDKPDGGIDSQNVKEIIEQVIKGL